MVHLNRIDEKRAESIGMQPLFYAARKEPVMLLKKSVDKVNSTANT